MMKTSVLLTALAFAWVSQGFSAETAKPLVSITAKRQLLGTEREQFFRTDAREKRVTLRVVIHNTSGAAIEGAELSGDVLVERAKNERERIVREMLKAVKLPVIKPNERITIDLGEISLNEVEWRGRKFEESLKEWKVVCKRAGLEIGRHLSSATYSTLEKKIVPEEPWEGRPDPRPHGPRPDKLRRLMN